MFQERFANIHLEITQSMVDSFLQDIELIYHHEWIEKDKLQILVIYGNNVYELPFVQMNDSLTLSINELTISEQQFAIALKGLLFEARKKKFGIETIKQRAHKRAEKRFAEIQAIQKKRLEQNEPIVAKPSISKEVERRVHQYEIDYVLMDLHDALKDNNQDLVQLCKQKLSQLLNEKN